MSPQSFRCPSCTASLEYDDPGAPTVRCPYCSTTVIVPHVLRNAAAARSAGATPDTGDEQLDTLAEIGLLLERGRKIEAIKRYREAFDVGLKEAKATVEALERGEAATVGETRADDGAGASRRVVSCLALLVVLAVGLAGAIIAGRPLVGGGSEPAETGPGAAQGTTEGAALTEAAPASTVPAEPGFVEVALTIGGEEGTGPGFFNDTRWLGLDGEGRIYTGDFEGGRVQVFDADGNFLQQWFTEGRGIISAMAVDRAGTVYVLEAGQGIFRYEGNSGELLGELPGVVSSARHLVVTVDGDLVAVGREGLARFDAAGTPVQEVPDFLEGVPGLEGPLVVADVAGDGENNLYVLPVFDPVVYKFNPQGAFVDRFGQEGNGAGDFTSPTALAVDGQGRVFVEDFPGILVFDAAGRYLETIEAGGVAFTLLFDVHNDLYRMDRNGNRVLKYTLLR